jgi:hypothetical protein
MVNFEKIRLLNIAQKSGELIKINYDSDTIIICKLDDNTIDKWYNILNDNFMFDINIVEITRGNEYKNIDNKTKYITVHIELKLIDNIVINYDRVLKLTKIYGKLN